MSQTTCILLEIFVFSYSILDEKGSPWEHLARPGSARRATDDSHQPVLKREKR